MMAYASLVPQLQEWSAQAVEGKSFVVDNLSIDLLLEGTVSNSQVMNFYKDGAIQLAQ